MGSNNGECKKQLTFDAVKKIISAFIDKNQCYEVKSYSIQNAGGSVVGFQGDYYDMTVDASIGGKTRRIHCFLKSLPSDEEKARKLREAGYFDRELSVYTKILSEFDKIQKSTRYHARCSFSSESDIILENLREHGYRITDSRTSFDVDHCLTALWSLAKFHAASWILEESKTKLLNTKYRIEHEFGDVLNECGYKYEGWYIAGMEAALAVASKSTKYGDETRHFETVKAKWNELYRQALDLCCPSKTERNVMAHRDLWANNLMFKYDKDQKPINCILVDYQACRCMPPMGDVVSLLYLNMTSKQRQNTFEDLVKNYYKMLSSELKKHDIEIAEIIKWGEFWTQCQVYKLWALVQCTILQQLALLKRDDVDSVLAEADYDRLLNNTRNDFVLEIMNKDSIYKSRILDSTDELIETFILV